MAKIVQFSPGSSGVNETHPAVNSDNRMKKKLNLYFELIADFVLLKDYTLQRISSF